MAEPNTEGQKNEEEKFEPLVQVRTLKRSRGTAQKGKRPEKVLEAIRDIKANEVVIPDVKARVIEKDEVKGMQRKPDIYVDIAQQGDKIAALDRVKKQSHNRLVTSLYVNDKPDIEGVEKNKAKDTEPTWLLQVPEAERDNSPPLGLKLRHLVKGVKKNERDTVLCDIVALREIKKDEKVYMSNKTTNSMSKDGGVTTALSKHAGPKTVGASGGPAAVLSAGRPASSFSRGSVLPSSTGTTAPTQAPLFNPGSAGNRFQDLNFESMKPNQAGSLLLQFEKHLENLKLQAKRLVQKDILDKRAADSREAESQARVDRTRTETSIKQAESYNKALNQKEINDSDARVRQVQENRKLIEEELKRNTALGEMQMKEAVTDKVLPYIQENLNVVKRLQTMTNQYFSTIEQGTNVKKELLEIEREELKSIAKLFKEYEEKLKKSEPGLSAYIGAGEPYTNGVIRSYDELIKRNNELYKENQKPVPEVIMTDAPGDDPDTDVDMPDAGPSPLAGRLDDATKTITRLRDELKKMAEKNKDDIAKLNNTIKETNKELKQAKNDLKKKPGDSVLQEKIASLQSQLTNEKNQNKANQEEKKTLEKSLKEAKKKAEETDKLQKELSAAQSTRDEAFALNKANDKKLKEFEESMELNKQQTQKLQETLQAREADLKKKDEEISDLKKQLDDLKTRTKEAEDSFQNIQATLQLKNTLLEGTRGDIKMLEQVRDRAIRRNKQLDKQIQDLNEQNAKLNQEQQEQFDFSIQVKEDLGKKIKELEDEIKKLEGTNTQLTAENSQLKAEMKGLQEQLNKATESNNSISTELKLVTTTVDATGAVNYAQMTEEQRHQLEEQKKKVATLKKQLQDTQKNLQDIEKKNTSLTQASADDKARLEQQAQSEMAKSKELQKTIDELNTKLVDITSQLDASRQINTKGQEQNIELQGKLNNIRETADLLEKKRDAMAEEIKNLKTSNIDVTNEKEKLQNQLDQSNKAISTLEGQIITLTTKDMGSKRVRTNLTNQIRKLQAQLKSRKRNNETLARRLNNIKPSAQPLISSTQAPQAEPLEPQVPAPPANTQAPQQEQQPDDTPSDDDIRTVLLNEINSKIANQPLSLEALVQVEGFDSTSAKDDNLKKYVKEATKLFKTNTNETSDQVGNAQQEIQTIVQSSDFQDKLQKISPTIRENILKKYQTSTKKIDRDLVEFKKRLLQNNVTFKTIKTQFQDIKKANDIDTFKSAVNNIATYLDINDVQGFDNIDAEMGDLNSLMNKIKNGVRQLFEKTKASIGIQNAADIRKYDTSANEIVESLNLSEDQRTALQGVQDRQETPPTRTDLPESPEQPQVRQDEPVVDMNVDTVETQPQVRKTTTDAPPPLVQENNDENIATLQDSQPPPPPGPVPDTDPDEDVPGLELDQVQTQEQDQVQPAARGFMTAAMAQNQPNQTIEGTAATYENPPATVLGQAQNPSTQLSDNQVAPNQKMPNGFYNPLINQRVLRNPGVQLGAYTLARKAEDDAAQGATQIRDDDTTPPVAERRDEDITPEMIDDIDLSMVQDKDKTTEDKQPEKEDGQDNNQTDNQTTTEPSVAREPVFGNNANAQKFKSLYEDGRIVFMDMGLGDNFNEFLGWPSMASDNSIPKPASQLGPQRKAIIGRLQNFISARILKQFNDFRKANGEINPTATFTNIDEMKKAYEITMSSMIYDKFEAQKRKGSKQKYYIFFNYKNLLTPVLNIDYTVGTNNQGIPIVQKMLNDLKNKGMSDALDIIKQAGKSFARGEKRTTPKATESSTSLTQKRQRTEEPDPSLINFREGEFQEEILPGDIRVDGINNYEKQKNVSFINNRSNEARTKINTFFVTKAADLDYDDKDPKEYIKEELMSSDNNETLASQVVDTIQNRYNALAHKISPVVDKAIMYAFLNQTSIPIFMEGDTYIVSVYQPKELREDLQPIKVTVIDGKIEVANESAVAENENEYIGFIRDSDFFEFMFNRNN